MRGHHRNVKDICNFFDLRGKRIFFNPNIATRPFAPIQKSNQKFLAQSSNASPMVRYVVAFDTSRVLSTIHSNGIDVSDTRREYLEWIKVIIAQAGKAHVSQCVLYLLISVFIFADPVQPANLRLIINLADGHRRRLPR